MPDRQEIRLTPPVKASIGSLVIAVPALFGVLHQWPSLPWWVSATIALVIVGLAYIGAWILWLRDRVRTLEEDMNTLRSRHNWLFEDDGTSALQANLQRFKQDAVSVREAGQHLEDSRDGN